MELVPDEAIEEHELRRHVLRSLQCCRSTDSVEKAIALKSVEEAIEAQRQLQQLPERGGFPIYKWRKKMLMEERGVN